MLNEKLNLNQEVFRKDVFKASSRDAFGEAMVELGEENSKVVALTANLKSSLKLDGFEEKFPDRFFEIGIAEQNMAGIATGLALSGKIPFMCSHAIFSPTINWGQIRLSVALTNSNVKIVGSHSGFSNGEDGSVAEPLEDIALMRVLPNIKVIHPIDFDQTKKAVFESSKIEGPVYIRFSKAETPKITTKKTPFKIGPAYKLIDGNNLTIISTGPITYEALIAARNIHAKHKISVEVIACPTIKPLDEKTIILSAKKTNNVVTLEEHQISGGLGGAIAELLSEKYPTKLLRIGMNDSFGESGSYKELLNKYRLDAEGIEEQIINFFGEKQWIY